MYNYPFSHADAMQYLTDIFDSTIIKDITQRHGVRDIAQLRQLVLYFIANTGNTFSVGSLVKYLKSQRRSLATETITITLSIVAQPAFYTWTTTASAKPCTEIT